MYELDFFNRVDIRMGSPYNGARVKLTGSQFIPNLEGHTFQDVGCVSQTGDRVLLVEWATGINEPRFIIWCIDENKRTIVKSQIIDGCCK